MSRRQRNPSRGNPGENRPPISPEKGASSQLVTSRGPCYNHRNEAPQAVENVPLADPPPEPGGTSQGVPSAGMDRLGLFIAMKLEPARYSTPDSSTEIVKKDDQSTGKPSRADHRAYDHQSKHRLKKILNSPMFPRTEPLRIQSSTERRFVTQQENQSQEPQASPPLISSSIVSLKTQHKLQTQRIYIKGTGDWEPVIAKIDNSSKYSLLDLDKSRELGLKLNPIPRSRAVRITLSNSPHVNPQFFANNVGIHSPSFGIPMAYIGIIVAPVSCEHEPADLVIGRRLLSMLSTMAKQSGNHKLASNFLRHFGRVSASENEASTSEPYGTHPELLESCSTSPDTFSTENREHSFPPSDSSVSILKSEDFYEPSTGNGMDMRDRSTIKDMELLAQCNGTF